MEPSYLELYRTGILKERAEDAVARLESCSLCPRECNVNRLKNEKGFCGTGRKIRIASYNSHFGEEAPLVGTNGSGTIFINSCNLLCSFCQNYDISHHNEGYELEPEQTAALMLQLADRGCHNINFVTPTHVVPQILEALVIAAENGLSLPLVYNSSGYDKKESLELLEGIFDIYMPDFKFWDSAWAEKYCEAPDYRETAESALREMHRQAGDLMLDDKGIAIKGLLVRHLVMPENISGTFEVMEFISNDISKNTYVNIMDQYRPCGNAIEDEFINRRVSSKEFSKAIEMAKRAGIERLDSRERIKFIMG